MCSTLINKVRSFNLHGEVLHHNVLVRRLTKGLQQLSRLAVVSLGSISCPVESLSHIYRWDRPGLCGHNGRLITPVHWRRASLPGTDVVGVMVVMVFTIYRRNTVFNRANSRAQSWTTLILFSRACRGMKNRAKLPF